MYLGDDQAQMAVYIMYSDYTNAINMAIGYAIMIPLT